MADWGLFVLAPRMCRSTNSRRVAQPEVWFRIIHVAESGHHRPLGHAYRRQTVDVTLGPKGTFKKGNLGVITRREAADSRSAIRPRHRRRQ